MFPPLFPSASPRIKTLRRVGFMLVGFLIINVAIWILALPDRSGRARLAQRELNALSGLAVSELIENHARWSLRATVDNIVQALDRLVEDGRARGLSEEALRAEALGLVKFQRIGETGFVCVLDASGGPPVWFPELPGGWNPTIRGKLEYLMKENQSGIARGVHIAWAERGGEESGLELRTAAASMRLLEALNWVVVAVCFQDELSRRLEPAAFSDAGWTRGNAFGRSLLLDRMGNPWSPPDDETPDFRKSPDNALVEELKARAEGSGIFPLPTRENGNQSAYATWRPVKETPWLVLTWVWRDVADKAVPGPGPWLMPIVLGVQVLLLAGMAWSVHSGESRIQSERAELERKLEAGIRERTHSIEDKMLGVERELDRVRQAEKDLLRRNQDLREQKEDAEEVSQRIQALTQMVDLLQTSKSVQETGEVIVQQAEKLFPIDSGVLYLFNEQNVLETITGWGDPLVVDGDFLNDDCWALRRGDIYELIGPDQKLVCGHVSAAPPQGYICMPIKARNEFFGLLHIQWGPPPTGVGAELLAKQLAVKKDLASTVTHQFSLALANLKLRDQLQAQSIKDQLTGLYNRRHMEASLIREAHRAKRHEKPMGVIMLDVDHFKKFNDTHGHEEGDELLRKLGALLKAAVRQEDIVCRYGGEEFLIIMPEAPVEIAVQRGRQLRDKVRGQLLVKGQPVTISVGVAIFPAHGATPESVIAAADSALYQAKDAGRDQVVVFKPKV